MQEGMLQTGIKALGKGKVGKRKDQYVLYFNNDTTELLAPYAHTKAILYFNDPPIAVVVSLVIDRSFTPPRVAAFLPKALNPTWGKFYGRDVIVIIELIGNPPPPGKGAGEGGSSDLGGGGYE